MTRIADAIQQFHEAIAARALAQAITWAGNASALARLAGYASTTGQKWVQRGFIPGAAAVKLAKVKGFPLSAREMCPGADLTRYAKRICPHCNRRVRLHSAGAGSHPMLKRRSPRRPIKAARGSAGVDLR